MMHLKKRRNGGKALAMRLLWGAVLAFVLTAVEARAQRQMEKLGRGMIALRTSSTQVYVGWRLLGNDPGDVGFNLYRSANGGAAVKVNSAPLTNTTDYVDTPANLATTAYTYSLKPVQNGVEVADIWANPLSVLNTAALPANSTARTYPYVRVPIQDTPDGALGVKFCWVGDLDGDGEYDFVIDRQPPGNSRQFLEAYKRDGTFLWRMDLGYNSTNHYNITPGSSTVGIGQGDNATVFDLDGDGKAEVIVRTAKGVVFADSSVVGGTDDTVQYLSILDGLTGVEKARATIPNPHSSAGQMNGNMGILYCDGVHPSIMWRSKNRNGDGSFNEVASCWDYRNGAITLRWTRDFDTLTHEASGHQIRIADPDNDGRDEYLDFGHGLDDDGTQLYANDGIGHGDRYTVGDIDPDRPGLETYIIQQDNPSGLATALYESATGKFIKTWYAGGIVDVGRGLAAPLDPGVKGYQLDSTQPGIFDCKGNLLYANSFFPTEPLWWDSDLCREYLRDDTTVRISKFNVGYYDLIDKNTDAPGVYQADGGRPAFLGDILGDWREDILVVEGNNAALRIYISNHPATNRLYTLMQNPQYRDQTTVKGYVQSSMVDYYLGPFMTPPPPPPHSMAKLVWRGGAGNVWDGASANWRTNWFYVGNANTNPAPCSAGDSILFDTTGSNNTAIALSGALTPGDVTVYSPQDYIFDGSAGSLGGTMKLTKQGRGTLTLTGTNNFTGATTVWDGALLVNGDLQGGPVTVWGGTYGGPLALGKTGGRIGGTGRFSQPVTIRYRGTVTPGAGMTNAGTLTFGNGLKTEDGATFAMDLSDDPSGTTKTNDLINVIGNLTLQGTNTFVIQKLNPNLPAGVYPLIKYTGAFSGSLNNLRVSGLDGLPVVLTNATGQLALLVKSTRPATTITWTGGQGGNVWDVAVTTNWFNGTSKDLFVPQDTVRFDNTGAASLTVNITGSLAAAGVVVDSSSNYVFNGSGNLVGSASLVKTNTGTLTINPVNNAYTGRTLISGGTVVVPKLDAVGFPSPLGNAGASPTNLVLSGNATLRLMGECYTDRGMTLNAGTNSVEVYNSADQFTCAGLITGSGALQKLGPGMFAVSVRNSYSGGTIINGGSIALEGNDGNSYGIGTGPVTFINGTLSLMDLEQSLGYGYNFIVPTNGSGRIDFDGRSNMTGSLTGGGTFTVNTVFVRTDLNGDWSAFNGQINIITSAGGSFRCGKTYGYPNAKINVGNGVSFQNRVGGTPTISVGELSGVQGGNVSGGTGSDGTAVNWSVGGLNTSATMACSTYNNVGFIKVGTGTWTWTGTNVSHTGQTTINGGTLQIGNGGTLGMLSTGNVTDNATLAFNRSDFITDTNSGVISGSGNLAQRGTGQLALTKAHAYAGVTTVEMGTLALTGSGAIANSSNLIVSAGALFDVSGTTSGAMTLASGKKISGFGSVKGNFTVGSGATLAPGGSIGTLTFSNALTLAAGGTNLFELSKAPLTNDMVRVFGALTCGGTLMVTNIGVTPLAGGDRFRLFNAASYSGTFSKVILPPLPTGLAWNTNALNTSGSLSVVITAQPVIGMISLAGNGLGFTGTGGVANANYYLLGATNLTTPLSDWTRLLTNQFDPGGNFNFTNAMNRDSSSRFYLLQLP
jgi:autotransporter-associated beta strand protein